MASTVSKPLATLNDLVRLIVLGGGYVLVLVIPCRLDDWIIDRLTWLVSAVRSKRRSRVRDRMEELLGDRGRRDFDALARGYLRLRVENVWVRLRALHGRTGTTTEVVGLEHIINARLAGKGAILWRMRFCDAPATNEALWRHGFGLVHLSNATHGTADSRLGVRMVGPVFAHAELRFMKERIVMQPDGSLDYLRLLVDRLEANQIVSIYGESGRGSRLMVSANLFNGTRAFASGAAALARRTGAALLTAYAVRVGPRRYRLVIEPPMQFDSKASRSEFIGQAVAGFAQRLQQHIIEYPDSWIFWEVED